MPLSRIARGLVDMTTVAAVLLVAAACSEKAPPPRRVIPTVDRPATDARTQTRYRADNLIRLDDIYPALEWEGGEIGSAADPLKAWEFDGSAEGWSLRSGAEPRVVDGRLVYSLGKGEALLSPEGLGVRFRSIRSIEIALSVPEGESLTVFWSPGQEFTRTLSVTSVLKPGPDTVVYAVKASTLTDFEGLDLNRMRIGITGPAGKEVAVDWIRLIPLEGSYSGLDHGIGRETITEQSRHVIYTGAPGAFEANVTIPPDPVLEVGVGVLDATPGATFDVSVTDGGRETPLLSREVLQDTAWVDLSADLGRWAGKKVRLRFAVSSPRAGTVALWSNPTIFQRGAPLPGPNVIVYLLDSLRADHVGIYGAKNETTPAIDRLAHEGAWFSHCSSQASWTQPSVPSILTSLYPPEHGSIDDGIKVSEGVVTLAEQFRMSGYLTAGFLGNSKTGVASGLDQGYDQLFERPAVIGTPETLNRTAEVDYSKQSGEKINRRLIPWLEKNVDRRFMLYVHSMDPHLPYLPPPPYDTMFATGYRGPVDGSNGKWDRQSGFWAARTPEEIAHVMSLYDGDIRCNDDAIGELLAAIERLGLSRDTIIIIVADHGDEFHEHGWFGHGQSLYEELLHVPLVVHWPGAIAPGQRIDLPIQTIDIYPTLCALAGLPPVEDVRGRDRAAMLARVDTAAGGPAGNGSPQNPGASTQAPSAAEPLFAWRYPREGEEEVSVFDGQYKLIRRPVSGDLLFDLLADPGETTNLARSSVDRVDRLDQEIESWWAGRSRIVSGSDSTGIEIDQERMKWLEALGYVK